MSIVEESHGVEGNVTRFVHLIFVFPELVFLHFFSLTLPPCLKKTLATKTTNYQTFCCVLEGNAPNAVGRGLIGFMRNVLFLSISPFFPTVNVDKNDDGKIRPLHNYCTKKNEWVRYLSKTVSVVVVDLCVAVLASTWGLLLEHQWDGYDLCSSQGSLYE